MSDPQLWLLAVSTFFGGFGLFLGGIGLMYFGMGQNKEGKSE